MIDLVVFVVIVLCTAVIVLGCSNIFFTWYARKREHESQQFILNLNVSTKSSI